MQPSVAEDPAIPPELAADFQRLTDAVKVGLSVPFEGRQLVRLVYSAIVLAALLPNSRPISAALNTLYSYTCPISVLANVTFRRPWLDVRGCGCGCVPYYSRQRLTRLRSIAERR